MMTSVLLGPSVSQWLLVKIFHLTVKIQKR